MRWSVAKRATASTAAASETRFGYMRPGWFATHSSVLAAAVEAPKLTWACLSVACEQPNASVCVQLGCQTQLYIQAQEAKDGPRDLATESIEDKVTSFPASTARAKQSTESTSNLNTAAAWGETVCRLVWSALIPEPLVSIVTTGTVSQPTNLSPSHTPQSSPPPPTATTTARGRMVSDWLSSDSCLFTSVTSDACPTITASEVFHQDVAVVFWRLR
eukprot:SAG31_NODE_267_length_18790_cov_3.661655_17_plen_217_part_00